MDESARSTGTALMVVGPTHSREIALRYAPRPHASFLVQLIATDRRVPQTRVRRRIDPREASAAYRARLIRRIATGRLLSVSA